MKGLALRGLTGLVFVVIMLLGSFWNAYSFMILFGIIAGLCLWEFLGLVLESGLDRKIIGLYIGLFPYFLSTLYHLDVMKDSAQFLFQESLLFFKCGAFTW